MSTSLTLIFIFSVIGLLDTLYLISRKVAKKDVYCLFFPKEWCQKVQYSKYSKTFGVPNSVAGFVMYALILVLSYLFFQGVLPFFWAQIVIGAGFLFSMYFLYIQASVLKAYCTWCVLSAISFSVMAVVAFLF